MKNRDLTPISNERNPNSATSKLAIRVDWKLMGPARFHWQSMQLRILRFALVGRFTQPFKGRFVFVYFTDLHTRAGLFIY
jgi:hypothetical protein